MSLVRMKTLCRVFCYLYGNQQTWLVVTLLVCQNAAGQNKTYVEVGGYVKSCPSFDLVYFTAYSYLVLTQTITKLYSIRPVIIQQRCNIKTYNLTIFCFAEFSLGKCKLLL